MRRWILVLRIGLRLVFRPSSSHFHLVEELCKGELEKRPNDRYAMWFLANHYVKYEKYQEAEILLEALIDLGRDSKSVMLLLSRVYFNLGKYSKVEQILRDSAKLSDKDTANYYLGYSLIELGKNERGITYLNRYIKHHPKDYWALCKLGSVYYRKGMYDDALKSYEKAEKIEPSKEEIKEGINLCFKKISEDRRTVQ